MGNKENAKNSVTIILGSIDIIALAFNDEVWMMKVYIYAILLRINFYGKCSRFAQNSAEMLHIEHSWLKHYKIVERFLSEYYFKIILIN